MILPVAKSLGIPESNVFCNKVIFDDEGMYGLGMIDCGLLRSAERERAWGVLFSSLSGLPEPARLVRSWPDHFPGWMVHVDSCKTGVKNSQKYMTVLSTCHQDSMMRIVLQHNLMCSPSTKVARVTPIEIVCTSQQWK